MIQTDNLATLLTEPTIGAGSQAAISLTAAQGAENQFLINPWLGLIGLAALVLSGAIAVIREIQIEEEDGNA
ncbi:MAG: hypothetical protein CMK07_13060 [Ponticaulis sp.]|nr:hypothetical protein [Ponticaulis sp.]